MLSMLHKVPACKFTRDFISTNENFVFIRKFSTNTVTEPRLGKLEKVSEARRNVDSPISREPDQHICVSVGLKNRLNPNQFRV